MSRAILTTNGDFQFEETEESSVESSTEGEVEETEREISNTVFALREGSITIFNTELQKDDIIIALLFISVSLQLGDFLNE